MALPYTLIGIDPAAVEYLESGGDVCFGKMYSKTNPSCVECRAPVAINGRIALLKEVCAAKCAGVEEPYRLNSLSSNEVLKRLEQGQSYAQVFKEILGSNPPELAASAARQMLVDRLVYLKSVGFECQPVPRAKFLLGDGK